MSAEPVSSLMHRPAVCIEMDATLADVRKLFAERALSWAPVVEERGNKVVGVISAHDLTRWDAEREDAARMPAWQICTWRPLTVAPDTPLAEVARQMVERHVHHVVVIDGDVVAGVVSSLDFVRRFAERG